MAGRPKKDGLDYFPFDVDFFEDERIGAISGEFGIKGEITAVKLLCAIYRKGYFILWDEAQKMSLLKCLPGISLELLERIVFRLVKWGYFEQDLFSSVKVLTSKEIQERYFTAIRRRKNIKDCQYLLINVCNNPINVCNNSINADNNPQRKDNSKLLSYSFKDNTTTPPTGARACEGGKGLPVYNKLLESSLKSKPWLETLCMNYRMGMERITSLLREFVTDSECRGFDDTGKTLRDFKSHFNNWLLVRLRVENEQKRRDNGDRQGNGAAATREQRITEAADLVRQRLARDDAQALR